MTRRFVGVAAVLLAVGCGSGGGSDEQDSGGDSEGLVLDFTAYVEGAVQVSGVGVSQDDGTVAVVTDFEKVLLVDPETVAPFAEFSAQLGELPEQGSAEAIAFLSTGEVAVLYPEHKVLRIFEDDWSGTAEADIDLSPIEGFMHGAMTIAPATNTAYVLVGTAPLELVSICLEDATVASRTELAGDFDDEMTGLSLSIDGSDDHLWAVTEGNVAYDIDVAAGEASRVAVLAEVAESSGAEAFYNPMGEAVLAVSDDADEYNAEPGPIRLYLVGD